MGMSRRFLRRLFTRQDRINYGLEKRPPFSRRRRRDNGLENKHEQPWEAAMTCCVAALCDKGKSIILVADKMIGMGMIEGEPEITKILNFHRHWRVMIAGDDIPPVFPIVDAVRQKFARRRALNVREVMEAFNSNFANEREDVAEAMHLVPRGWTVKSFNSRAAEIIPKRYRKEIAEKFYGQTIEVSLLVAGFDASGKGHIFSIDEFEHRGHARRHDIPGFHAIGSGADGAIYMMTYREVSSSMPLRLMLYYAIEGKYFGELAGGVGPKTDVYVLRAGKSPFKLTKKVLDEKLFKLCERVQPKRLSKDHVDVLNNLQGTHLDEIPKLKREKKDKEWVIS
jgi:20S proteasome alpha/beta subunit